MKKLFGIAIIAALLTACEKESKVEKTNEPDTKTVELNNCSEKTANDSTPEICFTELNDSRCPLNATCPWDGIAIAKFSLKANGTEHQLTLATVKIAGYPSNDTTVAGYKVKLVEVKPYPGLPTPEPTRAILQITR